MASRIATLDSAKEEFQDIKKYVKKEFCDLVGNAVNAENIKTIQRIKAVIAVVGFKIGNERALRFAKRTK